MYTINWSSKAKKQLRKIDRVAQMAISDAVDDLESFPNTPNVIARGGH